MPEAPPFRFAEVMASLAIATDLAMGQPVDHALRSCGLALGLADRAGLAEVERRDVFYQSLLRFIGCNAETANIASLLGNEIELRRGFAIVDAGVPLEVLRLALRSAWRKQAGSGLPSRFAAWIQTLPRLDAMASDIFPGHCEVAARLGERLGFPRDFVAGLGQLYARWDGTGVPATRGEAIRPAVRVVTLAQDLATFHCHGGAEGAIGVARKRRGRQYDPRLVDIFLAAPLELLGASFVPTRWLDLLALEPEPHLLIEEARLDAVFEVMADFADIKSPWTLMHSKRVAELAARAAPALGVDSTLVRRAGLLHDLGRVAVSSAIWEKPAMLSESEWEQVRLHSYHTSRILSPTPALARFAFLASSTHERSDATGYFRGVGEAGLGLASRLLAAADMFTALAEERPYRPAHAMTGAAELLRAEAAARRLDAAAVDAVLDATGQTRASRRERESSGLTPRERDVLRLLSRGMTNKAIGRALGTSPKTVDKQVQSLYAALGVRSRAGATLQAMERGLLD